MSKYLYQSCGPKPMTRVDINDNNQSSNNNDFILVFPIRKSLYGLKQTYFTWYAKMDNFLLGTDFSRYHPDPNVYTKRVGWHTKIPFLYFNDLILTCSDPKHLTYVSAILKNRFEMIDL
jgi:hypothetical protein